MSEESPQNPPTRLLKTEIAPNGTQYATSTLSPKNVGVWSAVPRGVQLPGLVIFVHGVNSEGEWYTDAEKHLCAGLNIRLGLEKTEFALEPNKYNENGMFPVEIIEKGRSPVIRFYWGYSAKKGTEKEYVIPLRTEQGMSYTDLSDEQIKNSTDPFFWGGGPFQNGCTSLYSLWSKEGFSKWLKKIPLPFSTQVIN